MTSQQLSYLLAGCVPSGCLGFQYIDPLDPLDTPRPPDGASGCLIEIGLGDGIVQISFSGGLYTLAGYNKPTASNKIPIDRRFFVGSLEDFNNMTITPEINYASGNIVLNWF